MRCFFQGFCLFLGLLPTWMFAQTASIQGQVLDAFDQEGLAYASVSIHLPTDSQIVAGSLADEEGRFSLREVPSGTFYLRVSFLGYEPLMVENFILEKGENKELGRLQLSPVQRLLDEIEITG
ncbi:MAG: carboxypeptidase-like regulatory domain-containing protein, partial [Bacteroidota bacterium]